MIMFERFLMLALLFSSSLVNAGHGEITLDKGNKISDELILPQKESEWSIKPRVLAGIMYFKHITFATEKLSNKPIAFGGLGLNVNFDKWFFYGYGLDSAKTTDHIFEPKSALSESNSVFQRQDYAVTIGREVSDLFSDSKNWSLSLFTGYRYGETKLQSTTVNFNSSSVNIVTGVSEPDTLTLTSGKYTVKGILAGIGLKVKPFEKSNSQLGLNIGYGRLEGKYSHADSYPILKTSNSEVSDSGKVGTWITAVSWEGQLTPKLSYSFVVDYYAYDMPAYRETQPFVLKEAVGSFKAFLNYHF